MLKKPLWQKLQIFPSLWPLNQLLNLGLFNIHKMRGPNCHVVFSPKKNFQEVQLHQTLILFFEFWHMSRIIAFSTKVCPRFSKKILVLILFVF